MPIPEIGPENQWFFLSFFSEIPASNKCPPVNLEKDIATTSCSKFLNLLFNNQTNKSLFSLLVQVKDMNMGFLALFVCVQVLRPSQPNGVMSSAVSLPIHMFTGQA